MQINVIRFFRTNKDNLKSLKYTVIYLIENFMLKDHRINGHLFEPADIGKDAYKSRLI